MKNFETLEVGKSYRNDAGVIIKIKDKQTDNNGKITFTDGVYHYLQNGEWLRFDFSKSHYKDLIELIEEPEFEPKTRGGYDYNIIRRDRGDGYMNVEVFHDGVWILIIYDYDGCQPSMYPQAFSLIPINPRKNELQAKEAELLKQLEEVKQELNNL